MFELSAEGIYPTIDAVKQKLGKVRLGFNKNLVWRDVLSELGLS